MVREVENKMTYDKLIDRIFLEGKGVFEDMECYIQKSEEMELTLHDGQVSNHTVSSTEGLSFRGLIDGKMGYSYTEKVDESSIAMLVNDARDNGRYIDSQDREIIYGGSEDYEEFSREKSNLASIVVDRKIDLLQKLEKGALDFSDQIKSVNYCVYKESTSAIKIRNTKGLDLEEEDRMGYVYLSVVAKEGEDIQTGSVSKVVRDFEDFDYRELVAEACRDALSMLGAKSIQSGQYDLIIYNKTFTSLLGAFVSVFTADSVQKGMSLMEGKLGQEVASPIFTLKEDPHTYHGLKSRSFDDEGTATYPKDIISKGELKTHLYNWKTALKDEGKSTGNGFRNSYKGGNTTALTNLIVGPGEKEFRDLLAELDEGLLITDLQGLHSGLNPVSGDFSLSATGYEIKESKIYRPINQITIAGNLVDLLRNIDQLGSDTSMSANAIESPSVLVRGLAVSGE